LEATTLTNQWDQAEILIANYKREPSSPLMLLQDLQEEYGYVPPETLELVTRELGIPLEELYGLATFYKAFSLEARGRHKIKVCLGTACVVRGAQGILEGFLRELKLGGPGPTPDEMFSLEVVNCVGACALGPVAIVDGEYVGHMNQPLIKQVAQNVRARDAEERQPQAAA
jgi:NADH-quinone oxidoreductase subunit E